MAAVFTASVASPTTIVTGHPRIAPSPAILSRLLSHNIDPEVIWTAVLLQAVAPGIRVALPSSLGDVVAWADTNHCPHLLE